MKQTKLEERVSYKACLFIQQEKKKTERPSPIQNLKPPILFLETHHLISILTPITFLFYCILKKKPFVENAGLSS
jgi:hypothetical protein